MDHPLDTEGLPYVSTTFQLPNLDGSLTLAEIYDWHLDNSPNHPLFVLRPVDGELHTIRWVEGVKIIHRAANYFNTHIGFPKSETVAILAIIDAFSYFIATVGLMRAGYQPFPLSNRNSPSAVAHLIKEMKVKHILTTDDYSTQQLLRSSLDILQSEGVELGCIALPRFGEELITPTQSFTRCSPLVKPKPDDPALVYHSSGSTTTFPKPIILTHRMLIERCRAYTCGDTNFCGHIMSMHCVPMYHASGSATILIAAATGLAISAFAPDSPVLTPGPEQVLKAAQETKSTMMICVPSFLESWAQSETDVEALKKFTSIMFAGAPLSKHVGDHLTGINVGIALLY